MEQKDFPHNVATTVLRRNPFFETADVFIHNAGKQEKTADHWYTHTNERHILQYVIDGEGTLECAGKTYCLSKNSLFLLPKGVRVTYYARKENPYRYYWIAFSGAYADILLQQSELTHEHPARVVSSPEVRRAFIRIYRLLGKQQSETVDLSVQPKIQAAFYEIFGVLLENKTARRPQSVTTIVSQATNILNAEYSLGIRVSDVCKRLYINRAYFSELFKQTTGISPADYLADLRVNEACRLLRETDMPAGAVAESVGMKPNAFFKFFSKYMRCSPLSYRRANR